MKKKFSIYLSENQRERFSRAAEMTNRSLSQFLVECGDQYIKRYMNKKADSLASRLSEIQKELDEMYGTVHRRASNE